MRRRQMYQPNLKSTERFDCNNRNFREPTEVWRSRRNHFLRKNIIPKNAVMALNELKGVSLSEFTLKSNPGGEVTALVTFNDKQYEGRGNTTLAAQNNACEKVLRDYVIAKMLENPRPVKSKNTAAVVSNEPMDTSEGNDTSKDDVDEKDISKADGENNDAPKAKANNGNTNGDGKATANSEGNATANGEDNATANGDGKDPSNLNDDDAEDDFAEDAEDEDAEMEAEDDVADTDVPILNLASFAIYKLFSEWKHEGFNIPEMTLEPASIKKEDAGPKNLKKTGKTSELPANWKDMHPATLLGTLRSGIQFIDKGVEGNLRSLAVKVDDREFVASGRSRKLARRNVAALACNTLFDTNFQLDKAASAFLVAKQNQKPPPPNWEATHPASLLTRMRPGTAYIDKGVIGEKSNVLQSMTVTVDGQVFVASGRSKKLARRNVAALACNTILNTNFELEVKTESAA